VCRFDPRFFFKSPHFKKEIFTCNYIFQLSLEEAKKLKFDPSVFTYTDKDVILYALGVYVASQKKKKKLASPYLGLLSLGSGATRHDLNLVYESAEAFATLPTFGVVPSFESQLAVPFNEFLPKFDAVNAIS